MTAVVIRLNSIALATNVVVATRCVFIGDWSGAVVHSGISTLLVRAITVDLRSMPERLNRKESRMDRKQRRRYARAIERLRAKGIETVVAPVAVDGDVTGMVQVRCHRCAKAGWMPADDLPPPHASALCSSCVEDISRGVE